MGKVATKMAGQDRGLDGEDEPGWDCLAKRSVVDVLLEICRPRGEYDAPSVDRQPHCTSRIHVEGLHGQLATVGERDTELID